MQLAGLRSSNFAGSRVRVSTAAPLATVARKPAVAVLAMKIYVGNLSWSTTQDDLFRHFEQFGQVEDAFVATDRETGRSRGFGFVTMNDEGAEEAIRSSDNAEFMGRNIRVNEAQPQGEGTRGGGGRGRGGFRGGRGGGRGYTGGRGGDRGYAPRDDQY